MIDLVLLVVIGLSALLGLLRGFVGIVVGTASWLLAGWAAFQFGDRAGHWLAADAVPSMTESVGGYALVFVAVLVAVALLGMLVRGGIEAMRLTGTDRILGFGLGLARGVLFAWVLVLLMGFTPWPREPAWQQSWLLPLLRPGADWMRAQLPVGLVADAGLGKLPISGDNADLDPGQAVAAMRGAVARALIPGTAETRSDAQRAGAKTVESAPVRDPRVDPEEVEIHGQARPPSQ